MPVGRWWSCTAELVLLTRGISYVKRKEGGVIKKIRGE